MDTAPTYQRDLARTAGKSSSTTFSMAPEKVAENWRWSGWLMKAVKSSLLLNVIKKACVKPCLSMSMLSTSWPLLDN